MVNKPNIREQTEKKEETLSPYAAKSKFSRGRLKWEEPCPIRTSFQRDRDRIIYSKAFRRLKHK
ncbi:MAG TPA: deoxyguanosinetriphosphate triphosphohydrolase, partial [Dehalococcoidia bacterium]|nr:deoxyguanosinetriphosphate triphosphohydrolase [Dehalococcoidia bacterium]